MFGLWRGCDTVGGCGRVGGGGVVMSAVCILFVLCENIGGSCSVDVIGIIVSEVFDDLFAKYLSLRECVMEDGDLS